MRLTALRLPLLAHGFYRAKIADHLAAISANAVDKDTIFVVMRSMRTMTKLFKKLSQDWHRPALTSANDEVNSREKKRLTVYW